MPDTRRAQLEIRKTAPTKSGQPFFLAFTASNGEPLGIGETHPSDDLAEESRAAWLRAMAEVLEDSGYGIIRPGEITEPTP